MFLKYFFYAIKMLNPNYCRCRQLKATVYMNNTPCVMEIDSGAKVSIIDYSAFKKFS